jgi:predicted lipoprotein with Yx(FWY)xxD motif
MQIKIITAAGLTAVAISAAACGSSASSGAGQGSPSSSAPASASGQAGAEGALKTATITRSGGSTQATYDGHPLYTYTADTAPGQANGNNINVEGGVWHEITASGAPAPATTPSTAAGGGNGY